MLFELCLIRWIEQSFSGLILRLRFTILIHIDFLGEDISIVSDIREIWTATSASNEKCSSNTDFPAHLQPVRTIIPRG